MMCDDFVCGALHAMEPWDAQRFLIQSRRWHAHSKRVAAAELAGMRVAPYYRLPLSERLTDETNRRVELDDVTAPGWEALAESETLREECEALEAFL